ncbi:MAG: hypothetical protein JNN29_10840, partial [Chitinophagaceae bacterium]|nr:hypothetical protein [Chitinophagaceae bacterium]
FSDFQAATTRFLEKGDFLRFRNLTLSYSLPNKLLGKWDMTHLRVFAQAQNLHTWYSFKGYDPEVFTGILTGAVYPALRVFTMGVSVGL